MRERFPYVVQSRKVTGSLLAIEFWETPLIYIHGRIYTDFNEKSWNALRSFVAYTF